MVLIAGLTEADSAQAALLAKAEVDAILIHCHGFEGEEQEKGQIASAVGDVPLGMWLDVMDESSLERLRKEGADFSVFEATAAPAVVLQEEDIGKVLKVDLPRDEALVSAINEMFVDVILMEVKQGGVALTVSDLIRCHWLSGMIDRPLLVASPGVVTDKEIRSLWGAGVQGLVVEAKDKRFQKSLGGMSEAMRSLPVEPKKRGGGRAMLPTLRDVSGLDVDD